MSEVYFATCLQDKEVWPIWQYLEEYDEQTLFSVIEILYDHIGVYNYEIDQSELHSGPLQRYAYATSCLRP